MSVIRSEKISSTDENLAAVSEVEPVFRDYARSDMANLRRPASLPSSTETALEPSTEASVNNINSLIQRVAAPSLTEIENLISELEVMRQMLHAEGQRVQREISGYGQLSQAAMKSTRMIADNVSEWKRAADGLRNG
jgi:chemotaxis protein histidine kinase CheA